MNKPNDQHQTTSEPLPACAGSALRYPVQIISYPTIRCEGNVTILGHIQWLTYNDFTSERKEFDSCRIFWNEWAGADNSWRGKLRSAWARLKHWQNAPHQATASDGRPQA
jgi:hypothetical protein